jgi:hypothetical protein
MLSLSGIWARQGFQNVDGPALAGPSNLCARQARLN